jgi:uncharacterized protein
MKRLFIAVLCALVAMALSGCREIHEAVHPTNDAPRSASPAPAGISSSKDVVKVLPASVSIPAGGNGDATLTLSISPGYHINANPATFSYLIATEVRRLPEPDGFCAVIGKIGYPAPITKKFVFAEKPLAVYEGDVVVMLPLHLPGPRERGCLAYALNGAHDSLPIEVRVQACDNEKCYAPDTLKTTIAVDVK